MIASAKLVAKIRALHVEADALRVPAVLGDFAARMRRSAIQTALLAAEHDLESVRALAQEEA